MKKNKAFTAIFLFILFFFSSLVLLSTGLKLLIGTDSSGIQGDFFTSIIGMGMTGLGGLLYFKTFIALKKNIYELKKGKYIVSLVLYLSAIILGMLLFLMLSIKSNRIEFDKFNPSPQMISQMNTEIYKQLETKETVTLRIWHRYDGPSGPRSQDEWERISYITVIAPIGEQNIKNYRKIPGQQQLIVEVNREGFERAMNVEKIISIQIYRNFYYDLITS